MTEKWLDLGEHITMEAAVKQAKEEESPIMRTRVLDKGDPGYARSYRYKVQALIVKPIEYDGERGWWIVEGFVKPEKNPKHSGEWVNLSYKPMSPEDAEIAAHRIKTEEKIKTRTVEVTKNYTPKYPKWWKDER